MDRIAYSQEGHVTLETQFGWSNACLFHGNLLSVLHSFIPPENRSGIDVDRPVVITEEGMFASNLPAPSVGDWVDVYYLHPFYGTIGAVGGAVVGQERYGDVVVSTVAIPAEGFAGIYGNAIAGVINGTYVGDGKYRFLEIPSPFMPFHSASGSPLVKDGIIVGVLSRVLLPLGTDPCTVLSHLPQPVFQDYIEKMYGFRLPGNAYILMEFVS